MTAKMKHPTPDDLTDEMRKQAKAEQDEPASEDEDPSQGVVTLGRLKKLSYNMVEEQAPLLGAWLSSGTINMIHGEVGIGKTWLVLHISLSVNIVRLTS